MFEQRNFARVNVSWPVACRTASKHVYIIMTVLVFNIKWEERIDQQL